MTREEETLQAVENIYPLPPMYSEEQRRSKEYAESYGRARDQQFGFIDGARWADEHPRKGLVDIDKVCEYFKPILTEYAGYYVGGDILDNFCKAMEE